jgi:hypothetical protein
MYLFDLTQINVSAEYGTDKKPLNMLWHEIQTSLGGKRPMQLIYRLGIAIFSGCALGAFTLALPVLLK